MAVPQHGGLEGAARGDASFPDALRAAVRRSGRSLESLRRRLEERGASVSIATLSYWQSGRSQPQRSASLEAVAHLEEILGVPRGHLVGRLGPPRRPGPSRGLPSAAPLPDEIPLGQRALEDLGFGVHHELVDVTVHDTIDVDAEGVQRVRTIRNVVRATRDGARRIPALLSVSEPTGEVAEFEAVSGCRIGRQVTHAREGVFAAEILLERALRIDETAAAEHRVVSPRGAAPDDAVEYFLLHRVTEIMVWVRFDPSRLPVSVETYTVTDGRTAMAQVDLAGATSVQHVVHRIGPGRVGIRWSF